jgi:glycerol-3-phosphate O-acyltransferase
VDDFDPEAREVIFVPVAVNYDRVLEDTILIAADKSGTRKFKPPLTGILWRIARHVGLRLTGRFRGFGVASVSFGEPLELSKYRVDDADDVTEKLAHELMQRIANVTPVVGLPLVARHILQAEPVQLSDLEASVAASIVVLKERKLPCPRRVTSEVVHDALSRMRARELVVESEGAIAVTEKGKDILTFYANSIAHHFDAGAENSDEIAAVAE